MGESINKEYEEFQKYLHKKGQKLKLLVKFDLDENIDEAIEEINKKEIIFNETNRRR
jgi:hypothetical protein